MTTAEAVLLLAMLLGVCLAGGLVMQVRAIAREVRTEGRETRSSLEQSVDRIAQMQAAELEALREQMQGRPQAAIQTLREAEAIPKPHRHIWRFRPPEATNGKQVRFATCTVEGCTDICREEED